MKNVFLFLLASTGISLFQTQSLNDFSKINLAEKPFTLTGTFGSDNPAVDAFRLQQETHIRRVSYTNSDQFFDKLMKPYKGKVVYIDFWAPWCGPCMREMPYSKELQKELAGKDIVFLYIGISCSKESWENTIKEKGIEGEHYFANDNDGKLLSEKFNISGIPRYVLVDKDGKVTDDQALRPSYRSKLVKKINGMLK